MSQVITILGNTQVIAATSTAANVAFTNCPTSTFRIMNGGATGAYAYVGITNTPITTFASPSAAAGAQGFAIAANTSMVLSGNFKANIDSTVYVYAKTSTSTATVFITPVIGF